MVDHDPEVFFGGDFDQLLALRSRTGERLFHEDMLAMEESGPGELIMRPHGRNDRDCVDIRGLDELAGIGDHRDGRICLLRTMARAGAALCYAVDARTV